VDKQNSKTEKNIEKTENRIKYYLLNKLNCCVRGYYNSWLSAYLSRLSIERTERRNWRIIKHG
jgi:hypothetical protein